jgi:hypothetical protein
MQNNNNTKSPLSQESINRVKIEQKDRNLGYSNIELYIIRIILF